MRDFLAFQEFKPVEARYGNQCIWCLKDNPKDRSHIISRKLAVRNHITNLLRGSVCANCNRKFSQLELWILRNTPLGWIRLYFYHDSNRFSNTNCIFSYFYTNEFQDWIVFTIEGTKETRHIVCQLILKKNKLKFISEYDPDTASLYYNRISDDIQNNDFVEDIEKDLPEDFSPRAIIDNDRIIVIAKDADGSLEFKKHIQDAKFGVPATTDHVKPTDDGRTFQHFRWSKSNWVRFCAKIAFESLCLFEGAELCLRSEFDQVRSYAISSISKQDRKLIFNEHGPVRGSDTPMPVFVDLSNGQNCPQNLNAPLIQSGAGMHTIAVYEINGWTCASISISGFPPSFLVMGGPEVHLRDFYISQYDVEEDEFHYLKLAYDKSTPVIPIQIEGGQVDEIAKTYNLRNM